MAQYTLVPESAMEIGSLTRFEVGGVALCVGRLDSGECFAIADECTHEEIELSDGDLQGCEIECPAHGSRFNVKTGEVRGLPASVPIRVYPLEVESGLLVVSVGEPVHP
jgi:3-phenylpropionate/trans-cinnamate dioxygenase ferredoxin subunit